MGDELLKKHAAKGFFKCLNPKCVSCIDGFKKITAEKSCLEIHQVEKYIISNMNE